MRMPSAVTGAFFSVGAGAAGFCTDGAGVGVADACCGVVAWGAGAFLTGGTLGMGGSGGGGMKEGPWISSSGRGMEIEGSAIFLGDEKDGRGAGAGADTGVIGS